MEPYQAFNNEGDPIAQPAPLPPVVSGDDNIGHAGLHNPDAAPDLIGE